MRGGALLSHAMGFGLGCEPGKGLGVSGLSAMRG